MCNSTFNYCIEHHVNRKSTCVCKESNWEYFLKCVTGSLNTDLLATAKETNKAVASVPTCCVKPLDNKAGSVHIT